MDRRKRDPKTARSKLERWIIDSGGPSKVCKMLDINYATINNWITHNRIPSLQNTIKMIEMSDGLLSPQDIFEGSRPL